MAYGVSRVVAVEDAGEAGIGPGLMKIDLSARSEAGHEEGCQTGAVDMVAVLREKTRLLFRLR